MPKLIFFGTASCALGLSESIKGARAGTGESHKQDGNMVIRVLYCSLLELRTFVNFWQVGCLFVLPWLLKIPVQH
jgi:hypothetical protein